MNNCAVLTLAIVALSSYVQMKNRPDADLIAANVAISKQADQSAADARLAYAEAAKALAEEKKRIAAQCPG